MKHETTDHFDQSDITKVIEAARPDQILRLLRDIAATGTAERKGSANE